MCRIIFTCDKGSVADSLRALATAIESAEDPEEVTSFETYEAAADITW